MLFGRCKRIVVIYSNLILEYDAFYVHKANKNLGCRLAVQAFSERLDDANEVSSSAWSSQSTSSSEDSIAGVCRPRSLRTTRHQHHRKVCNIAAHVRSNLRHSIDNQTTGKKFMVVTKNYKLVQNE